MKKKVYFILSAGWGPITRALPIANKLKEKKIGTYFHVSGRVSSAMEKAGHKKVSPVVHLPQKGNPQRDWWTLDHFLACFGWQDEEFVEKRLESYIAAIKQVNPDVLVVDFNTTAMMAARILQIPTVAIVQSCFHPQRKHPYIIWWKNPPKKLPTVIGTINKVLSKYGGKQAANTEELQVGDITLIPSFPEFDPLSEINDTTFYVGPILGNQKLNRSESKDDFLKEDILTVVYPGRPKDAGGQSGQAIISAVIPAIARLKNKTLISQGWFDYTDNANKSDLIHFIDWLDLEKYADKISIMIHHGGHGACLSAITLGIPSLVCPTFAEREYNARNLAGLGAGISIPFDELQPESVGQSLAQLQEDDTFVQKVKWWHDELLRRNYGGIEEATGHILSLL